MPQSYQQIGMVPIEHHTTVHDDDSAQPIGHEPIVHENNCAPCRLDTLPVDAIVHQKTLHRIDCARPIGYGSTAHRYDCAPYSLNTVAVVKTEHRSLCTESIVHERLGKIQSFTNTNGHRDDCTHRFLSKWARENSARS